MLARLEVRHQIGVLTLAQQVAANGRRVQVRGVEIDEGFVALFRRGNVDPLGLGALEGIVDLATGQVHAADGAIAHQLGPAGRLEDVLAHQRRLGSRGGPRFDQPQIHGHGMGRTHDDLVDHHHGHGGAGDGVDRNRALVAGTTDYHALVDVDAAVVGVEVVNLLLGNTDEHDGFVVLEHVGIDDDALGVEQDLHVDRLAGVGRHVRDVDALEGVPVDRAHPVRKGAHLVLALGLGNFGDFREKQLDALLLCFVLFCLCHGYTEHQSQEDRKASYPAARGADDCKT